MAWQRILSRILTRDEYKCRGCREGSRPGNVLLVSHVSRPGNDTLGIEPDSKFVTICERCNASRLPAVRQTQQAGSPL